MAKPFKLPKRINGFKLPKRSRKQANKLIARLQGEELEALVIAMLSAVITHFANRAKEGSVPLGRKLTDTVQGHLKH